MKAELQQLIALQNLDTAIRKLEKDLESIPQRRAEIEAEFDQRAFEIKSIEIRRDEAKLARAKLENEATEQKGRVERAERNLMASQRQDEYTAAIREADAARKQISQLETQILEQLESLEKAEAELNERASEIASLNTDREARLQAVDDDTRGETTQLATAKIERERVFNALPKALSAQYSRIKTKIRDGVAVAEAKNRSCAACFMALRPQVMSEIRRGDEIIICDNCGRILYYIAVDPLKSDTATQNASV